MRFSIFCLGLTLVLQACLPIAAAEEDVLVMVYDEAGQLHRLTKRDIAEIPHRSVKTKLGEHETQFEGISLAEFLELLGVKLGKDLRVPRASNVVVVDAADGYRAVFALVELDPATSDKLVLVADKQDDKPLDEKAGPLRLVIPDEHRPVRWIRMIRAIHVISLKDLPLESAPARILEPNKNGK